MAAAIPVFSIIGRFGSGWLGDVYNKKYTMVVTLCLMGMGLLTFCYLRQGWIILIFLFLFSSGCWGTMILSRTIQREYFGIDSFGKILGVIMGLGSLEVIIGPTLAGWVFDTFGSYYFVWLLFLCFIVMAIILVLRIEP